MFWCVPAVMLEPMIGCHWLLVQVLHGYVDCLVDVVVTGPVLPRRVGTGFVCTLHFCNFRILPDTGDDCFGCCWWLVCFWLGFQAFHGLVSF